MSGSLVYFVSGFVLNVQYGYFVRITFGSMFLVRFRAFLQRVESVVNLPCKQESVEHDASGDRLRLIEASFQWGIENRKTC